MFEGLLGLAFELWQTSNPKIKNLYFSRECAHDSPVNQLSSPLLSTEELEEVVTETVAPNS